MLETAKDLRLEARGSPFSRTMILQDMVWVSAFWCIRMAQSKSINKYSWEHKTFLNQCSQMKVSLCIKTGNSWKCTKAKEHPKVFLQLGLIEEINRLDNLILPENNHIRSKSGSSKSVHAFPTKGTKVAILILQFFHFARLWLCWRCSRIIRQKKGSYQS